MLTIIDGPNDMINANVAQRIQAYLQKRGTQVKGLAIGNLETDLDVFPTLLNKLSRMVDAPKIHNIFVGSWLSVKRHDRESNKMQRITPVRQRMLERVAMSLGVTLIYVFDTESDKRAGKSLVDPTTDMTTIILVDKNMNKKKLETIRIIRTPQAPYPFIGYWHPDSTLLIGDRPNQRGTESMLPFVPTINLNSGCSGWLVQALIKEGIGERRLCWVNAFPRNEDPLDPDLVRRGQFRKVIALGAVAHTWAETNGIEHQMVEHPQFWKRFHYDEPYPLMTMLREGAPDV